MKEFIDKLIERLEEQKGTESDYSSIEGKKLVMHWNNCVDVCKEIVNKLAEEFNVSEMPTGWIPCKRELPKQNEEVLASLLVNGKPLVMEITYDHTWLDDDLSKLIAWQPLPAPYTEGE